MTKIGQIETMAMDGISTVLSDIVLIAHGL